ncbi:Gfo/Idh/MocA family protein [Haloferula chungangensis]|uniref:Gfo/Idh/MocA family protein n=1 Tax=Haloferula chungangensis TaxID=1048331 RepID=A0ABW2L823_9BACT
MNTPLPYNRRRFLATGAAALGVAPMAFLRAQGGSPNDEIAIALVGCGSMGNGNMKNFLNIKGVRVVAVSDVDRKNMARSQKIVNDFYKNKDCKTYADYTDLLQHPGLDAICLATPDHWHAKIGIDAANAGLDIYGEKPFTWGLKEGRELNEAITKNKVVWQTGSWQRSKGEFRRFKALIENNTLGKITKMECGTPSGMSIKKLPVSDQPPANLDWDAWCGPAGKFEYNSQIHPWNWRWMNNFGGGQLLDWVGHHVDIALWSLGLDKTGPVKVEGKGELGDHKLFDTYVKYAYEGTFEDGRVIAVSSDFMGTKFTGENGWLHADRGKLNASDRELLRNLPEDFNTKPPSHHQDFINCMRNRETPQSDAEGSHRSASFGQLALVALDSGRPLKWDPKAEKVIGDDEQAKHPRLGSRVANYKG